MDGLIKTRACGLLRLPRTKAISDPICQKLGVLLFMRSLIVVYPILLTSNL